jgi:hypothetical protein
MAALTRGILSLMFLVSRVETSTSEGTTVELAGTRRRSSKVYAGSMTSDSIFNLLEKWCKCFCGDDRNLKKEYLPTAAAIYGRILLKQG